MTPHDGATNMFNGISTQLIFLKDILDRLGVNMQLIRHGKYKSAGEMFIRSSASKENLEQNTAMVTSMWKSWASEIAASREITEAELNAMLDNLELNFPSKILCKEDCLGLCQRCGKDLNEGDCGCKDDEIDPRLAPLAKLLAEMQAKEKEGKSPSPSIISSLNKP